MGFIRKTYDKSIVRYDELPYLTYFTAKNFPGLEYESYSFMSEENRLDGFFYHYDNYKKDIIVIFCHGIGGGHLSYMQEINMLAKGGYLVLAYDNTGCCASQGQNIKALTHSLTDLDYAIRSLKEKEEYKDKKIYVVGHSWGGYAASNIYNYQQVDKVVAISPFISAKQEFKAIVNNPLLFFIPNRLLKIEKEYNPNYALSSAVDALNKPYAKGLVIHATNDNVVLYKYNTGLLKQKCTNPNIEFYIVDDKYHHPQYMKDGVIYFNQTFETFDKLTKEKKIQTLEQQKEYFKDIDWMKMVRPDEEVWKVIYGFLAK